MLLRVEQGKGGKDRYAMLSPQLLELLRDWCRIARPRVWLFPGRDPLLPITTRQLHRVCHGAAERAGLPKLGVAAHAAALASRRTCWSNGLDVRVIQVLLRTATYCQRTAG